MMSGRFNISPRLLTGRVRTVSYRLIKHLFKPNRLLLLHSSNCSGRNESESTGNGRFAARPNRPPRCGRERARNLEAENGRLQELLALPAHEEERELRRHWWQWWGR